MSVDHHLILEYESRLNRLKNWPEKAVIHELSSFALRNPQISNHVADILISRLIDPNTNKNYKVPLFYLVDSTMRNSGKQFIALFSSHIVVAFQRVFNEVLDIDKARLDYLLSTWETRAQLPESVLMEMRNIVGTRIVSEDVPRIVTPGSYDRTAGISYGRGAVGNESHLAGGYFNALELRKEMEIELQQMHNAMGSQTRFGLDQLKAINPQLYTQIEKTAYEKLEKKRKEGPSSSSFNDSGPLDPEKLKNRMISGFINEQPIVFDLGATYDLSVKLRSWNSEKSNFPGLESLKEASIYASARLSDYLKHIDAMPPLPPLIAENNPPDDLLQQRIAEADKAEPKEKLPIPKFRHDLLGRPPKDSLKALYVDRSFYCRQDGMRFKTQTELANHLDMLFIRNQDKQRKEGTRTYRQWYCKESQWVTDFGSLKRVETDKAPAANIAKADGKPAEIPDEEMVLPADEHFTRCPVSNEAFLPEWDTEEGDYMYRNAVKVLLTEKADSQLYRLAQPTIYPLIRYIIVHQKLVMDGWLAAGKSASLYETIQKINKKYGAESEVGRVLVSAYVHAAGEEEDSNDIFILFEPLEPTNELSISDSIYQYENRIKNEENHDLQSQVHHENNEDNEDNNIDDGAAEMKMELQDS